MEAPSRWVLLAAVALSSFSVGLSLVAVGCRTADAALEAPRPSTPAPSAAAPPLVATAQAAPARVERALPVSRPGVEVARLVVSADVLEREPVVNAGFVAGAPVTAFVELKNGGAASAVVVTFERGADRVGHVKLGVPASTSRYRTWATSRRVSQVGTWHAVVRSVDGAELARASFDVRESAPEAETAS